MKILLVFALVIALVKSKMLLTINDVNVKYEFKRVVNPNQICSGYFLLKSATQGSIDINIFSEDGKRIFSKRGLLSKEKIDFSFNTTEAQTFLISIMQGETINEGRIVVEYEFSSQTNTFNKSVAKTEVIDPALVGISRIEKLLYELSLQTFFRQKEVSAFSNSINDILISIPCINFIMFVAFAGILGYQMVSFKDFLKKKKLI
ncbi:hypothetical protein NEFER03_0996 [Nematocida sp. LUAm3]|nr:hypothetical protein NEFER03_0996 [Nematocida sp. LUAm3]